MRRSVTPPILAASCALCLAFVVSWAIDDRHDFATVSNLCYLAVAAQREHAASVHDRTAGRLVGVFNACPPILLLLGSASFAYHSDPVLNSELHFADIVFGQFLVLHLAHTLFSVALLSTVPPRAFAPSRSALALVFCLLVFLLIFAHERVYEWQLTFYGCCSSVAVCSVLYLRFLALPTCALPKVGLAVLEAAALLTAMVAAVFVQSELVGVKLGIGSREFGLYHGHWHFFLSAVVGACYGLAADVAERRPPSLLHLEDDPSKAVDVASLSFLAVYAVLALTFKEARLDVATAEAALAAAAFAYTGLAAVLLALGGTLNLRKELNERSVSEYPAGDKQSSRPLLSFTF